MIPPSRRVPLIDRHYAGLVAVFLLALALRLAVLDRDPLWSDEALTIVLARWPLGEMLWWPTDPTPPLYYALHKWLLPAGASAPLMRSISLVTGVLIVPVGYAAGRLLLSRSGALLVAALLATSAPLVDYSAEARAYSLLVLLVTASATTLVWWCVEVERAGRVTRVARFALALFTASTLAAFYTHVTAIPWIGVAVFVLLVHLDRRRLPGMTGHVATVCVAMSLLAVPGLVRFVRALSNPDHFNWLTQTGGAGFLKSIVSLILPFAQGIDRAHAVAPVQVALLLLVAAGAAWLVQRAWPVVSARARREPMGWAIVVALASMPLLLWLIGFVTQPVFMPRTALVAVPALALLAAAVVNGQPGRSVRLGLSVALPLASLLSLLVLGPARSREDWRGTAEALHHHVRAGDVVMVCAIWKYPALRHALASPLPAPVMVPFAGRALLLEDRFGGAGDWDQRVYAAYVRPSARAQLYGETAPDQPHDLVAARAGGSLWLVNSECQAEDRRVMDDLLGEPARWKEVWRSSPEREGGRIALLRHSAATLRPLPVDRPAVVHP